MIRKRFREADTLQLITHRGRLKAAVRSPSRLARERGRFSRKRPSSDSRACFSADETYF